MEVGMLLRPVCLKNCILSCDLDRSIFKEGNAYSMISERALCMLAGDCALILKFSSNLLQWQTPLNSTLWYQFGWLTFIQGHCCTRKWKRQCSFSRKYHTSVWVDFWMQPRPVGLFKLIPGNVQGREPLTSTGVRTQMSQFRSNFARWSKPFAGISKPQAPKPGQSPTSSSYQEGCSAVDFSPLWNIRKWTSGQTCKGGCQRRTA